MLPESVDANVSAEFEENGYVILRGILSPDVVNKARAEMNVLVDRCAESLIAAGKITDPRRDLPFETRLAHLYADHLDVAPKSFRRELHLAGLFDVFFNPDLLDVVEELLGEEIRLYPNYTARPKLPDWEGTRVLWHQDGTLTELSRPEARGKVDALRMVNVWSPLVPARVENGCMQFVPGTHKIGVVPHVKREHYHEIEEEYLAPYLGQEVPIELDPGDVVLFHNLLFHQGLPNYSKTIRWSLDWRYQDATQPSTLRTEVGHIARSRKNAEAAVGSAEEWANLTFR